MACETGNGSQITHAAWTQLNTALTVLGIDMGEVTKETLPYAPLTGSLEINCEGDFATARQITANGLFDISDVPTNGPDMDASTLGELTVTFSNGATYKDDAFQVTNTGPNLVNNELLEVTVVWQTTNDGTNRGWTAATP